VSIEAVHILPTNNTPEILLNPNGMIKISGRAIDESRAKFSEQLMIWIDSYIQNPAAATDVVIALEYMNSFNSIFISSVLSKLNSRVKELNVKWYIEEDDDDLLERAEHISEAFRIPIEFIRTNSS
jgi:hypothetical protein